MTVLRTKLRELWASLSRLDLAALFLVLLGSALLLLERFLPPAVPTGFVKYLSALAAIYLLFRLIGWSRTRLLWSLRSRLIVAYLFIAVVPVLLLVTLAYLGARIVYSQLGAYVIYSDVQRRIEMLADSAGHIAAAEGALPASVPSAVARDMFTAQAHAARDKELPGLVVDHEPDAGLLRRIAPNSDHFSGLLQSHGQLSVIALREMQGPNGPVVIRLSVPITAEFLERVAADLGPLQIGITERAEACKAGEFIFSIADDKYCTLAKVGTRKRALQAASSWLDPVILGNSTLEAVYLDGHRAVQLNHPVLVVFTERPSRVNHRIFSSLGTLSGLDVELFGAVALLFLLLEVAALVVGVILTRGITKAIAELYRATQYVQAEDLTHRVRIERRDQLGDLGVSFNLMMSKISSLIEEQRHRERLENEISIAREVQAQLFPQSFPDVPGVEIEAICRAARVVSGDYYDFIQLGPTQVALVIADISGKGISAALLMASLQAALRSAVLVPGSAEMSTAELVSRLNNHLVRNTSDDRFATLFFAVYDSSRRLLRYTNAGHLPGLCVCKGISRHLCEGGMVLGVVADYPYEEGTIEVEPGTLLIGYSDGLIEPENVYGEQFGIPRLEQAVVRRQGSSPSIVAETLMIAAEEWAGTAEQADDMTVIVARLG